MRSFKFSDGNMLNLLYKVMLPCVITDIEVSIFTDVVDSDISLLLSKDSMKRARTCLNFENDSVMMFKKKISLRFALSGHHHILTTKPLPDKSKFKHILSLKKSLRTSQKKLKLQQSYIDNLVILAVRNCDLVKNAWIRDPEFIRILQVLPNSCEECIC